MKGVSQTLVASFFSLHALKINEGLGTRDYACTQNFILRVSLPSCIALSYRTFPPLLSPNHCPCIREDKREKEDEEVWSLIKMLLARSTCSMQIVHQLCAVSLLSFLLLLFVLTDLSFGKTGRNTRRSLSKHAPATYKASAI